MDCKADIRPLLRVQGLKTYFHSYEGTARAVDDVSFHLERGETLGLVGESGCGKTITALSIMRLVPEPPGRIEDGRILLGETDLLQLSSDEMIDIRGKRVSMIFQEPMTCLNPVFTVGDQISEAIFLHQRISKKESWERTIEMLKLVQIPSPEKKGRDYPHQLSGGMRQRVMIAMALSCHPEVLIADEPTTALDVTIQAQILDLMMQLRNDLGTSIIMVTHNLGIIAEMAQRIVVMYAGKVVEEGQSVALFEDPRHPYTRGLLRSIPRLGERSKHGRQRLQEIPGMVPSLFDLPRGCSFYPRCGEAKSVCQHEAPQQITLEGNHEVCCWLHSGQS